VLQQRWPWLLAAGVVVVVFIITSVRFEKPGDWDDRPLGSLEDISRLRDRDDLNVLLIMVDTLRADRLSSYGYPRKTSPVLDHLAHAGVRFERHMAQSTWTKSSIASLMTGLYPQRNGISRYNHVIPSEARMPAEVLKEAGFKTYGLWRNGWVSPTFGFEQGYDIYQHPLSTGLPPNVRIENPTLAPGTDQNVVETAVELFRFSGKQRWFLYLHLMDLHEYVYDAETAVFGSDHSDLYDNSLLWVDGWYRMLVEALAESGQLDRTLIAITSDHGEAFRERGFEGHAREVFRETTEVPFILALPFRLEPGIVVKTRTQNVDVWPTLYDLLGIPGPAATDGRSRLPEILASARGEKPEDGVKVAISDLDQAWSQRTMDPLPAIAVVEEPFRYVRIRQPRDEGTLEFLFDSSQDPRELRDLSEEQPETLARLRAAADAYTETKPVWGEVPTRELSELELNLLRALGYKVD
jgi:arylsulfatase A-like enzyme